MTDFILIAAHGQIGDLLIIDHLDLTFAVYWYIFNRKLGEAGEDLEVSVATILGVCRTISYLDYIVTLLMLELNLTTIIDDCSAIRLIIGVAYLEVVFSQATEDVTCVSICF